MNTLYPDNQQTDLPTETQQQMKTLTKESSIPKLVLRLTICNLLKSHYRLCMKWSTKCKNLLKWSERFIRPETTQNMNDLGDWETLIANTHRMWEKLVAGGTVFMEMGDQDDHKEEVILEQEEVEVAEEGYDVD
jgi:hypothetical protein